MEITLNDISKKIVAIEGLMHQNTQLLKESLSIGKEHRFLLNNGIQGYKHKILKDHKLKEKPKEHLYSTIRYDKDLRYPHRKILDYLIDKYDHESGEFREAYFSEIVKACRLGKNKAREYLEFLVFKGYLRKREDGYRVWYQMKQSA